MALGILAIIIRHPEMMQELESGYDDNMLEQDAPALPTPLSKIEPPYAYRDHSLNYRKCYRCPYSLMFNLIALMQMIGYKGIFRFVQKMFQIMPTWADWFMFV